MRKSLFEFINTMFIEKSSKGNIIFFYLRNFMKILLRALLRTFRIITQTCYSDGRRHTPYTNIEFRHYPQLCPCMRAVDGALEDIYFVFYSMAKISFTCGLMPRHFLTYKCIRFSCIAFVVLFSSRFCPF